MSGKRLGIALLLAGTVVLSGCNKERNIVGRWQANTSTYYFHEDGILFYKSSTDAKFRGRFYLDKSTDPMVVQSRMRLVNGGAGTLNVKFIVQFLTADRIRLDFVGNSGNNRTIMLARMVGDIDTASGG